MLALISAPFLSTTSWRRKTWPSLHRRMATRRENALSWSIWSIHRATLTFRPKWRLPWESRMEPWWLWIACPVRFTYSRSWSIHFLSISVLSYSSVLDDVWLLCFGTSDFMNWLHVLELVPTCFALKILKRCTFTWISIEWNALRTRHHVSSLLMPTMRRSWVKYVWYLNSTAWSLKLLVQTCCRKLSREVFASAAKTRWKALDPRKTDEL